jgi:hypothetical protein
VVGRCPSVRDVEGRWRPLAATIAVALLAAAVVQSGRGANTPKPPPPGAISYGIPVPLAGNASFFQFHFKIKGGAAMPTATLPTGAHPPAGIRLFIDLSRNKSGSADVNALIVNPFPISAATPAPSGALNFWIVPARNETLSPAGSGPAFASINQWPAAPPADCKSGALANRSVFAPPHAWGYSLSANRDKLAAINSVLALVLPMQVADDLICDRPTSAAQAKPLGLPYLQANAETGAKTYVGASWHNIPGRPDVVLITGFPAEPKLSGRDAKECTAASRSTEFFVSCRPGSGQMDLRVQPKTSPRFEIKNVKTAFLLNHEEFGPFVSRPG